MSAAQDEHGKTSSTRIVLYVLVVGLVLAAGADILGWVVRDIIYDKFTLIILAALGSTGVRSSVKNLRQ